MIEYYIQGGDSVHFVHVNIEIWKKNVHFCSLFILKNNVHCEHGNIKNSNFVLLKIRVDYERTFFIKEFSCTV
jgi:hypothetical protein